MNLTPHTSRCTEVETFDTVVATRLDESPFPRRSYSQGRPTGRDRVRVLWPSDWTPRALTACSRSAGVRSVLTFLLLASGPVACGGRLEQEAQGECSATESCPQEREPRDATNTPLVPSADGNVGPVDASVALDALLEVGPEDTPAPDVGASDGTTADSGIAATEAGLPPTTPCLTGGNVLWLQANPASFWYSGSETIGDAGRWAAEAYDYYFVWDGTDVQAMALDAGPGAGWTLGFNSWNLDAGLQTGVVYDMAKGGSDFIGYLRSCNGMTGLVGQFRVDELKATDDHGGVGTLLSYTATFWAQCLNTTDPGPPGVLEGCVHYEQ
jgi:hypothetical protein